MTPVKRGKTVYKVRESRECDSKQGYLPASGLLHSLSEANAACSYGVSTSGSAKGGEMLVVIRVNAPAAMRLYGRYQQTIKDILPRDLRMVLS
jgi:hypothetical protein